MQKISNGGAPYALIMSGRKKSNKNNSTARTKKNKLDDLQSLSCCLHEHSFILFSLIMFVVMLWITLN
jgi:hypothetical protein